MHSYPFNSFFLTNTTGVVAGAGTSSENIAADELILTDRNLNVITGATASADLSTLHVVMAAVAKQPIVSAGISTRAIRLPISRQTYKAFTPQTFVISEADLTAKADATSGETFITLRIQREDSWTSSVSGQQWMVSTSFLANNQTNRAAALQGLADSLNRQSIYAGMFTAVYDATAKTLTITTVGPKLEEVGSLMTPIIRVNLLFDHTRDGLAPVSTTTFSVGQGTGIQIAQLEQSLDPAQQIPRFGPNPTGYTGRANKAGFYNVISIRWDAAFLGDQLNTEQRQLQVTAAFPTDASGTVGAQEAAFVAALNLAIPKAVSLVDADTTDLIEADAGGIEDGAEE